MALNAQKLFQDLNEQKIDEAETIDLKIGSQVYDVKIFNLIDPSDIVTKQNLTVYVGEFLEDIIRTNLLPEFIELDVETIANTMVFYLLLRTYTDVDFSDTHGLDRLTFLAILATSELPKILAKTLGEKKLEGFNEMALSIATDTLHKIGDGFMEAAQKEAN